MSTLTTPLIRFTALCLGVTALFAAPIFAHADSTPFSKIIVFGDSLSDTGNFHRLTQGFPPPPYADGRFSNGRLWVEYLAEDLGMELLPQDNYAVAGATTGHDNSNDAAFGQEFPGLQDQIEAFVSTHSTGADSDALYVVWAGANDFFVTLQTGGDPRAMIARGVANTVGAIQTLSAIGATHVVVLNIPDLGLTPFGRSSGMSAAITQLAAAYNQALAGALASLADAGLVIIQVDAFTTLQAMANSPADFGFTNVTHAFLSTGGSADEFLFWDAVHPTTRAHEVLEQAALDRIIDNFSPSRGRSTPPARVNALHGLAHASGNH